MKIVCIYGQNHKGSTYHIAKMLADKLQGEVKEFSCQEILITIVWDVPSALKRMKSFAHIMRI